MILSCQSINNAYISIRLNISYFRGRGEGIRLMLQEAEISYKQKLFMEDTWPAIKKKGIDSGLYTFGQGIKNVNFV